MIKLREIQRLVIGEMEKYCGCPFVPSNTTKEMPAYPYMSFSLIRDKLIGGTYSEGEKLYKALDLTYSFTVQAKSEQEAQIIAMKARDYLDEAGRLNFQEAGVVINNLTGITSRDNLLTIEYEYRRGFDAVIAVFNEINRPDHGIIEKANIKYEK